MVLTDLERFDDAIINYEKAIEIEPNYADAWYNKAELLKHQGLEDEATNCFNKVKEIEGNLLTSKNIDLYKLCEYFE